MEKITIIEIIKKIVLFICVSIAVITFMSLFSAMFGSSSPSTMTFDDYIFIILVMVLIGVVAKYLGDIVIVVLKSKREQV
jgi:hypothetical protein